MVPGVKPGAIFYLAVVCAGAIVLRNDARRDISQDCLVF